MPIRFYSHHQNAKDKNCLQQQLDTLKNVLKELTLSLTRVPNIKIQEKPQIPFCKILKNKWYHAKLLLSSFHLNGHTIGFHQQNEKLELHYMSPCITDSGRKRVK